MSYLIPAAAVSGMVGGLIVSSLIFWWYVQSGRFERFLNNAYKKARQKALGRSEAVQETIGIYDHVPDDVILKSANDLLHGYKEIELSTITHNKDKTNQYTCVLLVGRRVGIGNMI